MRTLETMRTEDVYPSELTENEDTLSERPGEHNLQRKSTAMLGDNVHIIQAVEIQAKRISGRG